MQHIHIGFIGQGWIGKNYADDFEKRGYKNVRYGLEEPYVHNRDQIADCPIVFIAVPTPTTPQGFDASILRDAITNCAAGTTVVIKSTLTPGMTNQLQDEFPDLFIMHSPEFLREKTAAYDAAHPDRNIIGIPVKDSVYEDKARQVLAVLPEAAYTTICSAAEAELIKYAGNCFLYTKVIFMNLLFDLADHMDLSWETIREAMVADPRIGSSHMNPVHTSGHGGQPGRGAGGHCFIKDFAAFRRLYADLVADTRGIAALQAIEDKNIQLLTDSGKDHDLLAGVYGDRL